MIDLGDGRSFVLKRLWEVGPALGVVWAMTAAHLASSWTLQMAMPLAVISGVATVED